MGKHGAAMRQGVYKRWISTAYGMTMNHASGTRVELAWPFTVMRGAARLNVMQFAKRQKLC